MSTHRRLVRKELDGGLWEYLGDGETVSSPERQHASFSIDARYSSTDHFDASDGRFLGDGGASEVKRTRDEEYLQSIKGRRACSRYWEGGTGQKTRLTACGTWGS